MQDDERIHVEASPLCPACGHRMCFHDGDEETCAVAPCLCANGALPTSDEVAVMWWLALPRNAAYHDVYAASRTVLEAELANPPTAP
jgi:hypothetical protein